jgi:acetylornithine deacetylase/succinyl-diaminopimelate desuccinylase-like protein
MSAIDWDKEGAACVALLADLIRIPTVNRGTRSDDDGNERPAAELLAEYFRGAGIEPKLFEKQKGRTSVVARVHGTGKKAPILLNAHLDVVEADASRWAHPPFEGKIHDGYLWGRGAIDMKHMAAMSACVMKLLAQRTDGGAPLERDVIFAGVADEEAGCHLGAHFLVDEHAEEIRAEYMLGEIGAFSQHLLGRTFYPIQVAEKGTVWVRAKFEADGGHGSMPIPNSAVVKLGRAIERLGRKHFPPHSTAVVAKFFEEIAKALPAPQRHVVARLRNTDLAAFVVRRVLPDPSLKRTFSALLSNTASPTVARAGNKVNVIPPEGTLEIDGRTLPGQSEAGFLAELRDVIGEDAHFDVFNSAPPVETEAAGEMYMHLTRILRGHDPKGHPIPYMIPGFTDAKAYARLGTKCYGFSPVKFDPAHKDVVFAKMYHGNDERIPIDGLTWGVRVLYHAVSTFCRGES